MANQSTEITTQSFGQRIINSIIGIPLGLIAIVVGIGILYWNEGGFDLSQLAKNAIEIEATKEAPSSANGKLVAVRGNVNSKERLGDTYIQPREYLALKRTSEMYAWVEETDSETQGNTGGSETTKTTYTYKKQWSEDVADSSTFNQKDGHINPEKSIPSKTDRVSSANIGKYSLDFSTIGLPQFSNVTLDTKNIILGNQLILTDDNKIYKGVEYGAPQIGDIRIEYGAVKNNFNGTVFGKLNRDSLKTFSDDNDHQLYRLFSGSKQDAVKTLHDEYTSKLWLFRLGGFIAIFVGLTLLMGPLTTLLSFFPTLGRIGSAAVFTIALPVALLISGVTILIGIIAHNIVVLIITLLITIGISVFFIRRRAHKITQTPNSKPSDANAPQLPIPPTTPVVSPLITPVAQTPQQPISSPQPPIQPTPQPPVSEPPQHSQNPPSSE